MKSSRDAQLCRTGEAGEWADNPGKALPCAKRRKCNDVDPPTEVCHSVRRLRTSVNEKRKRERKSVGASPKAGDPTRLRIGTKLPEDGVPEDGAPPLEFNGSRTAPALQPRPTASDARQREAAHHAACPPEQRATQQRSISTAKAARCKVHSEPNSGSKKNFSRRAHSGQKSTQTAATRFHVVGRVYPHSRDTFCPHAAAAPSEEQGCGAPCAARKGKRCAEPADAQGTTGAHAPLRFTKKGRESCPAEEATPHSTFGCGAPGDTCKVKRKTAHMGVAMHDGHNRKRPCLGAAHDSGVQVPVCDAAPDARLCGRGWHTRWPPPVSAMQGQRQASLRDFLVRPPAAPDPAPCGSGANAALAGR